MTETLVKEYYTGQVRKEWRRLVRDAYHRLEFMTTLHFLEKYLPPQGLILDAGGGTGPIHTRVGAPGLPGSFAGHDPCKPGVCPPAAKTHKTLRNGE